MALTFGGLGLALVGQDKSFKKTTEGAVTRIDKLWGSLKHLADGAGKLGARIGAGLSGMYGKAKGAVGKVSGLIDGLLQKSMSPKLDNAFSSMYAQFNKTFGSITVGMSISSKEAKKWRRVIGSTAFALNADMGEAAKAWAAFYKQGLKLDVLMGTKGMAKTMRALIKMTQVMGVSGEDLANMAAGLVKGFGFTEKGVRSLMDTVFTMGRYFNMGTEAMKGLPGILDVVNDQLADWKKGATAQDVREFMLQIVKTAGGLKEALGLSGEASIDFAKKIFTVLHENRRSFVNMMRGLPGEVGELGKALWQAGGDPSALLQIMRANMPKFLTLVRELDKKAKETGGETGAIYRQLQQTLRSTFGPNMVYLMTGNWDKATKKFVGLNDVMQKSAGALGKAISKAFKSGRTAGESYNIMMQNYQARLQRLTNKDVPEFMQASKKGFDAAYKKMAALAADKGPIGNVTRALLRMQRFGLSGLFLGTEQANTEMGFLASQFAMLSQTALPMITAMGALGLNLGTIGKLLSPGGLLIAGLALMNDKVREVVFSGLRKAFDYIQQNWRKWVPVFADILVKLWHGAIEVVNWLGDVGSYMIGKITNAIGSIDWASAIGGAFMQAGNAITYVVDLLATWIDKVNWGAIAEKIGGYIVDIVKGLFSFIANLITGGKSNSKIVNAFLHLARALGNALKEIVINLIKGMAKRVAGAIVNLAQKAADAVRGYIRKGKNALADLFGWERSTSAETTAAVAAHALNAAGSIGNAFASAAIAASDAMARSGTNIMTNSQIAANQVITHWANVTTDVNSNLGDLGARAQQTMKGLSIAALSAAKGVAQSVKASLKAIGVNVEGAGGMLTKLIGSIDAMIASVRKRGIDIGFMKPGLAAAKANIAESRIREKAIATLAKFMEARSSRRYLTLKGGAVPVLSRLVKERIGGRTLSEKELQAIYNQAVKDVMEKLRASAVSAIVPELGKYRGYTPAVIKKDSRVRKKLKKEASILYERGVFKGVSGKFAGNALYSRIESYLGRREGRGAGGVQRLKGIGAVSAASGAAGTGTGTAGMTKEQKERLVKVKERLSPEDREAFADIGYQVKILADAIRDLAQRSIVVNIHGKIREFLRATVEYSRQIGAGNVSPYAGRG